LLVHTSTLKVAAWQEPSDKIKFKTSLQERLIPKGQDGGSKIDSPPVYPNPKTTQKQNMGCTTQGAS